MLVAEWNGVPQYDESTVSSVMIIIPLAHFTIAMNILQLTTNTFQGVIITDGSTSYDGPTSYAVFLYYCPSMEWSGNAVIGWQASSSRYRNHPLSGTSNAKQVACLNTATSSYNTVLFKLSSASKLEPVHVTAYMYSICLSALCIDHSLSYHTLTGTCISSFDFGCFDGTCENSSSARCDGDSDCSDGSDEVACSCELPAPVHSATHIRSGVDVF